MTTQLNEVGDTAVVIAPYFKGDDLEALAPIRPIGGDALASTLARGGALSNLYEVTLLGSPSGRPSLALIGAAADADLDPLRLMRLSAAASRALTARGFTELVFLDRGSIGPAQFAQSTVEGAIRGTYDAGVRKTQREVNRKAAVISLVSSASRPELDAGARIGRIVGEASAFARDLVNLPPNEITPSAFAERAQEMADKTDLECEILDEHAMSTLGMGSLLGVAAGSAQPPRLIVLRYGDPNASIKLALVGKGLTFDSGGLSLKTAEGMETMKGDMAGGAAVVAGMMAIAELAPADISITAYVGATENMPGSRAMRPGDVLTAMNGETIEVLNTDAEGRLVLADVLAYASLQGATHIVDFATLTGGAVVALGHAATLATGKPWSWVERVVEGAARGLERAWPMPLYEDYRRAMDSEVADIKNTGGRWGSALTASAFLSDFVTAPNWAHMDIAGTSWADDSSPFRPKGGTGEGVGTIVGVVRGLTEK